MHSLDDSMHTRAPASVLTHNRQPAYSVARGVNADSPPSLRRLASKFCFYSLFTE
jgi:hypothetical protein